MLLTKEGYIYTIGNNIHGRLGIGNTTNKELPVRVKGNLSGVIDIAAGAGHALALLSNGEVYSWAENTHGRLGDGTQTDKTIPVRVLDNETGVQLRNVVKVAAGGGNSYFLKENGTLYACGYGSEGRNGVNNTNDYSKAVQVRSEDGLEYLIDIVQISSSCRNIVALSKTGEVYTWGYNGNGELGINSSTSQNSLPKKVVNLNGKDTLGNIINLQGNSSTATHVGVVDKLGRLIVWGNNT